MTITRLDPLPGYLDQHSTRSVGISQMVIAGDLVYWSGVVAAHGDLDEAVIAGVGDQSGQMSAILDELSRQLEDAGSSRHHIVSLTMYTTDVAGLAPLLPTVFAPWVGDHRPAVTVVGVAALAYPELMLEIQGVAVVDPGKRRTA